MAVNILFFLYLLVDHLGFPFNLGVMEGAVLQHFQRAVQGEAIFPEPTPGYVPLAYNPLYYYLSVPFAWKFHGYPSDYWRFTREGVLKLFPGIVFEDTRCSATTSRTGEEMPLDERVGLVYMAGGKHRRSGRYLRGLGHHLKPVTSVGRAGMTPGVVRQTDDALDDHELIKVKVGQAYEGEVADAIAGLAERTGAQIVGKVGRTALLYRRRTEDPGIELP